MTRIWLSVSRTALSLNTRGKMYFVISGSPAPVAAL